MIYPPKLAAGSRIRVVTAASPVKPGFIEPGLAWLRARGWQAEWDARGYRTEFYSAGTDEERAAELASALADPDAAAVWFARGGYGVGRLLPALDRLLPTPPAAPKVVIGCSDATFALVYLLQRWGWVVFHGPMVAGDIGRGPASFDEAYLAALLEGRPVRAAVTPAPLAVLADGPAARAPLTGGCLSILAATLGTPYEWQAEGRLLFLEDTQLKPYQLDRLLVQLRQAGKLDRCAGIVFGQLPDCVPPAGARYTLADAIRHALEGLTCPVLFGLPSGHCGAPSLPLALGAVYRLDPAAGQLHLEDPDLCPVS